MTMYIRTFFGDIIVFGRQLMPLQMQSVNTPKNDKVQRKYPPKEQILIKIKTLTTFTPSIYVHFRQKSEKS